MKVFQSQICTKGIELDQNLLCGGDQSAHFKSCLKQELEKEKQVKVVRLPQNRLNSVKK